MDRVQSTNYSRSVCDLYLPAMATALDIHIRVIQNISGYYAVLNTLPSKHDKPSRNMKAVNLVLEDNRYNLVVYIGEDAELKQHHEVIAELPSSGGNVQIPHHQTQKL